MAGFSQQASIIRRLCSDIIDLPPAPSAFTVHRPWLKTDRPAIKLNRERYSITLGLTSVEIKIEKESFSFVSVYISFFDFKCLC